MAATQAERKLLREINLFDVYEGDKLPAGKKSYAVSFVFRDDEQTLNDKAIEKAMERIMRAVAESTGAELRG
jgi:phenylalanyl-tRNA synthetase beta chain